MVKNTPNIASGQERCVRPSSACTQILSFPYIQGAPRSGGVASIVPAGLTAHIQFGAGSTDAVSVEGPKRTLHGYVAYYRS